MLCTVGMEGSLSFRDEIPLEVHIEATDEVALILKETIDLPNSMGGFCLSDSNEYYLSDHLGIG